MSQALGTFNDASDTMTTIDAPNTSAALSKHGRPSTATEDDQAADFEQEHAMGTGDERIRVRVRARGGEEVTWSREAARLAGTLKDLMDDAPPEDGVYPVPTMTATTLCMLGLLNDPDSTWPSADERSVSQLVELVEGTLFLDASRALEHIQCAIASRLNGKCAHELCALLGADGDFGSAEEHAASIAEPTFAPESCEAPKQANFGASPALLRQTFLSEMTATEDAKEAALALVDVATLAELKGVNRSWRALARRVLCSRLCRRDGQPAPTRLDDITDLDVEQLIEAGRPWEVAVAGRMLPGLARLHGYGFVVDVAKVRAAEVKNGLGDWRHPSGGSCFSGEGEPPLRLTIAAVACAGSGLVCGIPVQHMREDSITLLHMREDSITELNLSQKKLHGPAAMLVAYLIPAMGSLTHLSLGDNHLGNEGVEALSVGIKQSKSLSMLDLSNKLRSSTKFGPKGAAVLAKALAANSALTKMWVGSNQLGDQGATAICDALRENTASKVQELDLGGNGIGPDGAKAIGALCAAKGSLTECNLQSNRLGAKGWTAIFTALRDSKVSKISTWDLHAEDGIKASIKPLAEYIAVSGSLTNLW